MCQLNRLWSWQLRRRVFWATQSRRCQSTMESTKCGRSAASTSDTMSTLAIATQNPASRSRLLGKRSVGTVRIERAPSNLSCKITDDSINIVDQVFNHCLQLGKSWSLDRRSHYWSSSSCLSDWSMRDVRVMLCKWCWLWFLRRRRNYMPSPVEEWRMLQTHSMPSLCRRARGLVGWSVLTDDAKCFNQNIVLHCLFLLMCVWTWDRKMSEKTLGNGVLSAKGTPTLKSVTGNSNKNWTKFFQGKKWLT